MLPGLKVDRFARSRDSFIEPGYDLSIPLHWAGHNYLPLAVPKNIPPGKGEHRISITERKDPANDRIVFDLRLHDMMSRFSVSGSALLSHDRAVVDVRMRIEDAAMKLQKAYFARWSSWPNEELGVTWGLCHKCGQATSGRYANGGVWECPSGCP